MVKNNYGKIVNLSSVTGPMVADSGEVAYATTKAAILGFTKSLAIELVNNNINVNAIMPGYIMTPMVEGIAKDSNSSDPESVIRGIASGIPMGRLGTIEELVNYLNEDAEKFVKTLIYKVDNDFYAFLVIGDSEINETKILKLLNAKEVSLADIEDVMKIYASANLKELSDHMLLE